MGHGPAKSVTCEGPDWCTCPVLPRPDDNAIAADARHRVAPSPDGSALWFVTVTVAGRAVDPDEVRRGLQRLSLERPFVAGARYRGDRAEVQYWEQSPDAAGAVAQALRMWSDHEVSALLPAWQVVGLEVVERAVARNRRGRADRAQVRVLG